MVSNAGVSPGSCATFCVQLRVAFSFQALPHRIPPIFPAQRSHAPPLQMLKIPGRSFHWVCLRTHRRRSCNAASAYTAEAEFALSGDVARGKQFFASHCSACHSPVDTFKNLVQTKEPAQVQDLFLMPRGVKKQAAVTISSGESFAGELVQLDDFVVTIRDKSGLARSWSLEDSRRVKVEVTDPLQGHRDLLPKYSDQDIHDILAYLETLK